MRSRAARFSCALVVLAAIAAAAVFLIRSEQQLTARRSAVNAFDLHAREAIDALADLRASQQAYVAAGQGVAFWMPKVAQITSRVQQAVASLRSSATSAEATQAVADASTRLTDFGDADKRARDYLRSGQQLMAGDVIFTEGGDAAGKAARSLEAARLAEHQTADAAEAAVRQYEALALGAAAGVSVFVVLLLAATGNARRPADRAADHAAADSTTAPAADDRAEGPQHAEAARPVSPILRSAARLCTDFGAVRDVNGVRLLLSQAGELIDASGLIVWLGSPTGADLQPILAHGYPDDLMARLPNVPRSANNAAARAYRSGEVQVVRSKPGARRGAIVAPILAARGCIGALSAEIREGGETSESVEALAMIVAAQLAGVLAPAPEEQGEARAAL